MSYMIYVSKESGLITEEEKQKIFSCMVGLELPVWHEAFTMELIQKSLQDRLKHSGGLVRMPLPVGIGQASRNNHTILCLNALCMYTSELKSVLFALYSFIAEIFNDIPFSILHAAYKTWCDELRTSANTIKITR